VGPFVVVETAAGIEDALLAREARLRWPARLAFEGLVHPLVSTVLLRVSGQDPLMLDAQPEPPHVQLREAVDAGGGEGHAVIGANGARQPVLPKEPIEDGAHAHAFGGEQAVTRQQIASVLVGNRQRVAVHRVPRAEVAFEVGRPEIVGLGGRGRDDAGMLIVPPPAAFLDQPAASQQIARGTDRRPLAARMAGPQLGCCRRAAQITAAMSRGMRCGQ
jgi:hypothetical protein